MTAPIRTRVRLLLVDDDVVDRRAARRALASAEPDADVTEADEAAVALDALRAGSFDCVLLDLRMPKIDGLTLLRQIRSEGLTVPVVMLTGQGDEQTAVELMKAGALDYIPKSTLTPGRLAQSLRHVARVREADARAEAALRALEEANRAKDIFLATISHELRTPLTAMLGWLRMLRSGMLSEEKHERALKTIERNAQAQAKLVEDLLDISRVVAGKLQLEIALVDLADIVEAAVETMRPAASARGIALESDIDHTAGRVLGDANRLHQIVANLLANAVKFTPAEGRIAVGLRAVGADLQVSVRDNGKGIPPEFLPHLFEPFRQAEAADAHRRGGLGLGLAIVRQLAELHGGGVEAQSDGEGQGARFIVRLPRPTALSEAPLPMPRDPMGGALTTGLAGLRVLVVDDDVDARQRVAEALGGNGGEVTMATASSDVAAGVTLRRPDVLIFDVASADGRGYELIRSVRALSAADGGTTPAIALTSRARSDERVRALAAGFTTHVAKPIDPGELLVVVASIAGRLR